MSVQGIVHIFFLRKSVLLFGGFKKKQYLCTRFRETIVLRWLSEQLRCQGNVSLAQLVEQLTLNQWVEGSSPSGDTKVVAYVLQLLFFLGDLFLMDLFLMDLFLMDLFYRPILWTYFIDLFYRPILWTYFLFADSTW